MDEVIEGLSENDPVFVKQSVELEVGERMKGKLLFKYKNSLFIG